MLSPTPVAVCVLAWEVLYQLSKLTIRTFAQPTEANQKLRRYGASYIVALVHAVIVGMRGPWHLLALINAPVESKLVMPGAESPWFEATSSADATNLLFFSWLLYDSLHLFLAFPKLGGADTVAHHVGFICASLLCGLYSLLPFPFGWLISGELSSIPLNIRWLLINSGRGDTRALRVANHTFLILFFAMRVVGYGAGLVHLWIIRDHLLQLDAVVARPFLLVILALVVGGFGLNLTWFRKIVQMLRAQPRAKEKRAE